MTKQAQKPQGAVQIPTQPSNSISSGEAPDKFTQRRRGRVQLSPKETRTRIEAFASEREEAFVAAIRKEED